MAEDILTMRYEFFSWKGFFVGASIISVSLLLQSLIGFPEILAENLFGFSVLIIVSALIVGIASGSVLIYLIPPDQDVIGVAGIGSDDFSQHVALLLVIFALIQPIFSGFVFFFQYFGNDPLAPIWVLVAFAAPSAGFAAAMYDRQNAIAEDLKIYFSHYDTLNMVSLDWLHGLGPRTATYRMGMLESAAAKVQGLSVQGHNIVREKDQFVINK